MRTGKLPGCANITVHVFDVFVAVLEMALELAEDRPSKVARAAEQAHPHGWSLMT